MGNLATEVLYSQLFEEFCRFKRPVDLTFRNDFIERSSVVRFKQKNVISDIDPEFKTNYYFIVIHQSYINS